MSKKLDEMTPSEVCAWVRERVRSRLGDAAENKTLIHCSRGYYTVQLPGGKPKRMRRGKLAEYLKGLKVS